MTSYTSRFQSTLPRRERRAIQRKAKSLSVISIHAPAKGATRSRSQNSARGLFQSTLPRRERRIHTNQCIQCLLFQSTLPRRERRNQAIFFYKIYRFQSTLPRRERQNFIGGIANWIRISIHAPAKGATRVWEK